MNFTTTLGIEHCFYLLTFSRVFSFDYHKLFVRAINPGGEAVTFEIIKDSFNQWRIALPAPEWIIKYQHNLIDPVERNS